MPLDFISKPKLPMFFQSEFTECGLASLAMVACYHGHKIDLNSLRQQYAVSLKGATLEHLIVVAKRLSLGARALRLELDQLDDLRTPCILHWDLNHFVVLNKVQGDRVYIHDPARGKRVLHRSAVSQSFTGVALELEPTPEFVVCQAQKKVRLSDLWGGLVGWKQGIFQTLFLSLMLQFFVLASPLFLQLVIDEAVPSRNEYTLGFLAVLFAVFFLLQGLLEGVRSWVILSLSQTMTYQMVSNILGHMLSLPASFYEKRFVGDILNRLGSTHSIQQALSTSLVSAFIDGIMALVSAIVIFAYSGVLGLIILGSIVINASIAWFLFPKHRLRQEEELIARSEEQSHLIETIQASLTIKLFGRESQRESMWRNYFGRVINAGMAVGRLTLLQKSIETTLMGLQLVLVVYLAADLIMQDTFTVGMLFALILYRNNLTERAANLVERGVEFRLLGLHLDRLSDIVLSKKEEGLNIPQIADKTMQGSIKLDGVSFRYSKQDPLIFQNVSLSIDTGDFVAIVGASGGGKTTLLKVLLGLYSPTEGAVSIDGLPLPSFGLKSYRAQAGVVQQDDELLSGTIADNISLFDPVIDMERVIECAQMAQIHDDIMAMPMNYLSLVGDMGSALSGGQQQRILIARALYGRPKLLILDEGTANLDQKTDEKVADLIEKLSITRIVVAHRTELVNRATKVFEMSNGMLSQIK